MKQETNAPATLTRREMIGTTTGILAAAASLAGIGSATLAAAQNAPGEPVAPAPRPALKAAQDAVAAVQKTILTISREVWDKPAIGLKEFEAMEVHIRELETAGFKITACQAGGHPTNFVAEWSQGSSGPKIGFLAEYDALPGLGNAAEPAQKPASNGLTVGHGCGHNNLGAGCTGAGIALKAMMQKSGTPGTVRIYGCGAEENEGGKVYMAKAGLFDDLDAALAWHPAPVAATGEVYLAANRKIYVSWKGKTAHAGNSPWDGRSALDAAELFAHGVNLMREHVQPTARLHYIYEVAGVAPNIVPDEARIWMTARDANSENVNATVEWLRQLAEGAALGTQTKATFRVAIGMAEMVPNLTLSDRIHQHMLAMPPKWTDAEQTFAKTCQKEMGLKEDGMVESVMPVIKNFRIGGSSDLCDVSWIAPIGFFGWPSFPFGVSAHTWAVTACGGMSIGDKASLESATLLAAIGYELLTEPELRAAAKAELVKRLDGRKYQAVLDPDPKMLEEVARRFIKGPGDEPVTGIDAQPGS